MVLLESAELNYGGGFNHFDLVDTKTGEKFSSAQALTKDIVVIAFICNHCPYVVKIINEFSKLAKATQDFVQFVAISANDPDYRQEDSPDNMKIFAQEHGFIFPYLFDKSQEVAKSFDAVCTPDIFVYKKIKKMPSGAIKGADARLTSPSQYSLTHQSMSIVKDESNAADDTLEFGLVYRARFEDLSKALNDLRDNDMTSFEQLPSIGCSIKWSS